MNPIIFNLYKPIIFSVSHMGTYHTSHILPIPVLASKISQPWLFFTCVPPQGIIVRLCCYLTNMLLFLQVTSASWLRYVICHNTPLAFIPDTRDVCCRSTFSLAILSKMPNQNVSWLVEHLMGYFSVLVSFPSPAYVFAQTLPAKLFEKGASFCYCVIFRMVAGFAFPGESLTSGKVLRGRSPKAGKNMNIREFNTRKFRLGWVALLLEGVFLKEKVLAEWNKNKGIV